MKLGVLAAVFLFLTQPVVAYNPTFVEPPEQYEPILLDDDPYSQKDLLGTLEGFPELFEFTLSATVTLPVQIKQRAQTDLIPFRLIMVRVNEDGSGVTEVERFNQLPEEWQIVEYSHLGIELAETEQFEVTVGPGIYRVEIATSLNQGDYLLVFGDEPTDSGFFNTIVDAWVTQQHFGYSPLRILFSSLIYYPIGIVMLVMGIVYTWMRRNKFVDVS